MALRSYQNELLKQLKDPSEAAEYLNACYEDSEEVFLSGLRNVVEARGGVRAVAKLSELNRENLYRVLSERGNPKFYSLTSILDAIGISIQFTPTQKRRQAA
jgi:probable addiction module antidote protein